MRRVGARDRLQGIQAAHGVNGLGLRSTGRPRRHEGQERSRPHLLPRDSHVVGADDRASFGGGDFEALESKTIGCPQIALCRLIQGIVCTVVEQVGLGAGDVQTVQDVLARFLPAEQTHCGIVGDTPADSLKVVAAQQFSQLVLTGEHDADHQAAVHFEVGQHTQQTEDVGPDVVCFVDQDDGTQALHVKQGLAALLDRMHERAIVAGR